MSSHQSHFLLKNMAYHWLMIFLTLTLCAHLSKSADVFLSIDCGSSESYRDANGIVWVGDDNFVNTGESHSVSPNNSLADVVDTMRVFPTGKKNCYYIDSVKVGRVLVRASFYYGNYDGKSSPPTFALQFDGNKWTQVLTSNTEYYYYEVTYTMKKDSISVCLAKTHDGQSPFITALEIRSLEMSMYGEVDHSTPLFVWRRVAFGSNTTIRFQDDQYDRLWASGGLSPGTIGVTSEALFSETTDLNDRPPAAVVKHAMVGVSPNKSIDILMGFPNQETSVYINFFFSEITKLGPNQTRFFSVYKDNKSFSTPFAPRYENVTGKFTSGITVSSNTTFSLVPTANSTLPPLINAMEIFLIGDVELTDGTNTKDVQGLAALQKSFSVLQNSSGDPCLPVNYTWDWIQCNGDDSSPRVTALLLGGYNLSGLLPDFSSMTALQKIDMHNNKLRGPIPEFLGNLPKLKTLDIGNNQFSGNLPASLSTNNGLNLTVTGNPDLCTSSCKIPATAPAPANSSFKKKNILEVLLCCAFILSLIIL